MQLRRVLNSCTPEFSRSNIQSSYTSQTLVIDLIGWFSYDACGEFDPQSSGTSMTQYALATVNGTTYTAEVESWSHSVAQSTLNFTFAGVVLVPAETITIVQSTLKSAADLELHCEFHDDPVTCLFSGPLSVSGDSSRR